MSGSDSAPAWGTRALIGVGATGNATQLFPVGAPAGSMVSTVGSYPPAPPGGSVRRPTDGGLVQLLCSSNQVDGGYIELWDVAGLDRGTAPNNVNNGDFLTNAYLVANGTMIDRRNISGPADEASSFETEYKNIRFAKGLAIRYVGGGSIYVSPFIEGGFMVSTVAG